MSRFKQHTVWTGWAVPGHRAGARALACAALAWSAFAGAAGPSGGASEKDPWEPLNRKVFVFNGALDHFLIKPVAEGYVAVVPRPVRTGVGNVLGNVGDVWSAVNLALQGKATRAVEMTLRVSINTVLGLGGLLDIATEAGLERQSEDFGQTLAHWGAPSGPYLVLPVFGPSTLRDAIAFPVDQSYSSLATPTGDPQKALWITLKLTDGRADALPFTRMLDSIALDKYTFVRDAHLARRRSLIHDGSPPADESERPR